MMSLLHGRKALVRKVTPGMRGAIALLCLCLIAAVDYILVSQGPAFWYSIEPGEGILRTRAIHLRDATRWLVGVLVFPGIAISVLASGFSRSRLREWTSVTVFAFLVGLGILYAPLRWSYDWIRETHFDVPHLAVRVVTLVSLNSHWISFLVAVVVVTRWAWLRRHVERTR